MSSEVERILDREDLVPMMEQATAYWVAGTDPHEEHSDLESLEGFKEFNPDVAVAVGDQLEQYTVTVYKLLALFSLYIDESEEHDDNWDNRTDVEIMRDFGLALVELTKED